MPTVTAKPSLVPTLMSFASLPGTTVQTVTRSWSAGELLARKTKESAAVWAEGDELTFVYQGKADSVDICCGIQLPMQAVPGSDLWVLTVQVTDLSQAVISYGFLVDGQPLGTMADLQVWRGSQAPPPVQRAASLQGQIKPYTLHSDALGEQRELTVYLPPDHTSAHPVTVIYMADGQSVPEFAAVLEPLITDGRLPSTLLVGVHSPEGMFSDPSQHLRAQEYLPDDHSERFAAHEKFFVDEVRTWAETDLGAPTDREHRAVFGYSNGGVFAAAMGIRHPDTYGYALAFSAGMEPGAVTTPINSEFYLLAGTLEEGFHWNTQSFAQMLQIQGVSYVFRERVCGHDFIMWQEEFPAAVEWAFAHR